jgi:hypothetical protein
VARGLTAEGVEALDKALARHVERGTCRAWPPWWPAMRTSTSRRSGTRPSATPNPGLLTQRMVTSPEPVELVRDFRAAAYVAAGA